MRRPKTQGRKIGVNMCSRSELPRSGQVKSDAACFGRESFNCDFCEASFETHVVVCDTENTSEPFDTPEYEDQFEIGKLRETGGVKVDVDANHAQEGQ